MDKLFTSAKIKADGDSFTAIASTNTQDRQGESIDQSGWDLKNFKTNPIMLWMHDQTKPLGKISRIWVDKTGAKPALKFKGTISTVTDWGKAAKALIDDGVLNSFSVGFMPLEIDGENITKAELLEISLVSVPANSEARLVAQKSLENTGVKKSVIAKIIPEEKQEEKSDKTEVDVKQKFDEYDKEIADLKAELAKASNAATLAVKGLKHLNPQSKGRKHSVLQDRQTLVKVIAKASDKLFGEEMSEEKTRLYVNLIKSTSEKLIISQKEELNG